MQTRIDLNLMGMGLLLLSMYVVGCDSAHPLPPLSVTSLSFQDDAVIPERHTCTGEGVSPSVTITGVPPGTEQIALTLVNETDRSSHWVIWGIESQNGYLPSDIPTGVYQSGQFFQGLSYNGQHGYVPPCSSAGEAQRYTFTAYALNTIDIDELSETTSLETFRSHIHSHILASGTLTGIVY